MLSGFRDTDRLILLQLDDESLIKLCGVSSYTNSLCDEQFWAQRFAMKYGTTLWKYGVSHRDVYIDFSKLKGEQVYREALNRGYLEVVEALPKHYTTNHVDDLVREAYETGDAKLFKILINNGALFTPEELFQAVKEGRYIDVSTLMDNEVNHLYINDAVLLAAEYGQLAPMKVLLNKHSVDKEVLNEALEVAVDYGYVGLVDYLLSVGAELDDILEIAVSKGHSQLVDMLEKQGY